MERGELQKQLGIVGQSVAIHEIIDVIRQVAPTDLTVLITGESGTGKEIIAKAIHRASRREARAMISVNAGAIPEGIIESELFGHEKGAFTGASDTRKGYFELADGGTIFLDEIGELPTGTQVKFLRILESGEFMRVGSATPRKADVRVIAATNKDLEREVHEGHFRADLFFRLRSINIRIPPLRERREDIPLLVQFFIQQVAAKNNIPSSGISDDAMESLQNYNWPGNVRELRNVIESMVVIEKGRRIDAGSIQKYLRDTHETGRNLPVYTRRTPEQVERELIYRALLEMKNDIVQIREMLAQQAMRAETMADRSQYVEASVEGIPEEHSGRYVPLDEMERRMIVGALEHFEGNRRLAAKALNISERTLYRKIKEYGLI